MHIYIYIYIIYNVCIHACSYVCLHVCIYLPVNVGVIHVYACMYLCLHAHINCMYESIKAECMLLCCFQCSMCAIHTCAEDMLSTFIDFIIIALYSTCAAHIILTCVESAYKLPHEYLYVCTLLISCMHLLVYVQFAHDLHASSLLTNVHIRNSV